MTNPIRFGWSHPNDEEQSQNDFITLLVHKKIVRNFLENDFIIPTKIAGCLKIPAMDKKSNAIMKDVLGKNPNERIGFGMLKINLIPLGSPFTIESNGNDLIEYVKIHNQRTLII